MQEFEKESLSNEEAIAQAEITGRTMLETDPDFENVEPEVYKSEDGKERARWIVDSDKRKTWDRKIAYHEEKQPDPDDTEKTIKVETGRVKAITERKFIYDEDGNVLEIAGTNTDREHSWEESHIYDGESNLVGIEGEVTEGEKKGDTYNIRFETDTHGEYTRKSEINTTEKTVGGELTTCTIIKREHYDSNGNRVFGYQQETGNSDTLMMWDGNGHKAESAPEDITIEIN